MRAPGPGELGWIAWRHGALYHREYGWDARFEGHVAQVVADFALHHDPERERAWIAELGGHPVGSVLLVREDDFVARLRVLLVEPSARGRGVGRALIDACREFAIQAGYRKVVLWTNSVLVDARRLYERAGYRLVRSEPHQLFGSGLIGETWELDLPAVAVDPP